MNPDVSGCRYIWIYPDTSGMYPDTSGFIWIYPGFQGWGVREGKSKEAADD
jgi:hypothetical protein